VTAKSDTKSDGGVRAARASVKRRKTVLLLTHSGDYYVPDIVDAAIEKLGHHAIRINTDQYPSDGALTLAADAEGVRALLDMGALELDLSRVHAVWCRRIWTATAPMDVDARFAAAAANQARDAFAGALALLEDSGVRFVNSIGAQMRAEQKVVQLKSARDAGLVMPPTIITNDPIAARVFCAEHQDAGVVAKMLVPLSQTMDGSGAFVYTSAVDEDDLAALDESLRCAPMIFQRKIANKALEVRAIVVGREVFAAATAPGALDWRLGTGSPWQVHALPPAVKRACIALVANMGLVAGALDFLVDDDGPRGTHWFLEINPAGEWGWLEKDLSLPISHAFARALTKTS
jgi:glutathione synthase/RimK-type ligase-like ATP-grasp enzyme